MDSTEIQNIISFDTQPCHNSTLNDMALDIFKISYLPQAVDEEVLSANHREIKEQLASLKFYDLKADCPTHAGILMFGKNPKNFLFGAYVQYVRFAGTDVTSDFEFEHRFTGDLTTQMRIMEQFINSQIINKKAVAVEGTLHEEYIYKYPPYAIRELLYNAVIHRDYQANAPIKFYEFSDRIEISNPGGLFGIVRPENFPDKNDYRNPVIAEASKILGYVNTFNVGIKRAKAALHKNNNPEPVFELNDLTSFGCTVFKRHD